MIKFVLCIAFSVKFGDTNEQSVRSRQRIRQPEQLTVTSGKCFVSPNFFGINGVNLGRGIVRIWMFETPVSAEKIHFQ